MEKSKIDFFIIRTFDDLVFASVDFDSTRTQEIDDIIERLVLHRAKVIFDSEFGGDGTWASVIYGPTTCSTKCKNGEYDTFEVWYSDEDEPRGYQTREELNLEFLKRSFNKII